MVLFPSPSTLLPTLNLEPSSMTTKNWKVWPETGCSHVPMSAATVDHLGGKGSRVDTGRGCGLFLSTQTGHSNCSASSNTCLSIPLRRRDCSKWRTGPWPVAECKRYSFRFTSSFSAALTRARKESPAAWACSLGCSLIGVLIASSGEIETGAVCWVSVATWGVVS